MNERSLRVLEFTKIRSQLAQYCVSDMGQALCDGAERRPAALRMFGGCSRKRMRRTACWPIWAERR